MSIQKKHLGRARFVRWTNMTGQFTTYVMRDAVNNIIMGTEHIVDLDGLLKYVEGVPGYLFDDELDSAWIPTTDVELIYDLNNDSPPPEDFS